MSEVPVHAHRGSLVGERGRMSKSSGRRLSQRDPRLLGPGEKRQLAKEALA